MTEKFTAKTIEEAKKLASKKFGVAESKIKFEIVEEGKRGFLGIGKSDAVVRAHRSRCAGAYRSCRRWAPDSLKFCR